MDDLLKKILDFKFCYPIALISAGQYLNILEISYFFPTIMIIKISYFNIYHIYCLCILNEVYSLDLSARVIYLIRQKYQAIIFM